MNWKENKFGLLSLIFALLSFLIFNFGFRFVLLIYIPSSSSSLIGYYLLLLILVSLVLAILAILFSVVSFARKEKNRVFRIVGLVIGVLFLGLIFISIIPLYSHYSSTIAASGALEDASPTIAASGALEDASPTIAASGALEDAYNSQTMLVTTKEVTFHGQNDTLARTAIVEGAGGGIGNEQVCLSLGDYSGMGDASDFEGGQENNEEERIVYNGGGTRSVRFSVLCYYGNELLGLIRDSYNGVVDQEWASRCECVKDPEFSKQTCCLVALRIPR